MGKQNCWESKGCGREPGGAKTAEFGVCPAATAVKANGIHDGKNAGRACWAVAGTLCGGQVQGAFASKMSNCMACEFYKAVRVEEGANFMPTNAMLEKLG